MYKTTIFCVRPQCHSIYRAGEPLKLWHERRNFYTNKKNYIHAIHHEDKSMLRQSHIRKKKHFTRINKQGSIIIISLAEKVARFVDGDVFQAK